MDRSTKLPLLRKARLEKVEASIAATAPPPLLDKKLREQVARYAAWLSAQSQRSVLHKPGANPYSADAAREMHEYIENAGKTVRVGAKEVTIFAPFRPEHSALQ